MSILPSGPGASEGPANGRASERRASERRTTRVAPTEPNGAARPDGGPGIVSASADEAQRWVSNAVHPFPASAVTGWWERPDVQPRLRCQPDNGGVTVLGWSRN